MTITEVLKAEHESIEQTLFQMVGTEESDPQVFKIRQELLSELEDKLVPHVKIEEEVVYYRLKESSALPLEEMLVSFEEHQSILETLTKLLSLQLNFEKWKEVALDLKRIVEKHQKREKEILYPALERALTTQQQLQLKDEFTKERIQGWGSYSINKDHEFFFNRDERVRKV